MIYIFEDSVWDGPNNRWILRDSIEEEFLKHSLYSPLRDVMLEANFLSEKPCRATGDGDLTNDWEPVKGQPGKWKAKKGASAASLAKIAKISYNKANKIVQSQLGENYIINGKEYSNVEVGDIVYIEPEYIAISTEERIIKYPENYEKNILKIDSISNKINWYYKEIDNYREFQKNELRDNPNVYDRNFGGMYSTQTIIRKNYLKIENSKKVKDSLHRISKPDTFIYNVIRIVKPPKLEIERSIIKIWKD